MPIPDTNHPDTPSQDAPQRPRAQQITPPLLAPALERLITTGNPKQGAQRLIRNAETHGIDLKLIWGVPAESKTSQVPVRQVCMVVPGAGGTGMCFLSNPVKDRSLTPHYGDAATQVREIGACLEQALRELPRVADGRVRIAQMLFEPDQQWTDEVCKLAGMTSVGTLDYLRMDYSSRKRWSEDDSDWPTGVTVRPIHDLSMAQPGDDGNLLAAALEASYQGTLDCPELCGMRTMPDVIAGHQSTGKFDPSRWWIMLKDNEPVGCCLLSHCPANNSVELVYLGMSPSIQGHGFGKRLLKHAVRSLDIKESVSEVTCAVDRRNIPALKVYLSLEFKRFDARCGYVYPL